jgi:hypothetical protein
MPACWLQPECQLSSWAQGRRSAGGAREEVINPEGMPTRRQITMNDLPVGRSVCVLKTVKCVLLIGRYHTILMETGSREHAGQMAMEPKF